MKFLREEPPEQEPEKIIVLKLIKKSLECLSCDSYVEMEGGPIDEEWAKFRCPECGIINKIRWGIEL